MSKSISILSYQNSASSSSMSPKSSKLIDLKKLKKLSSGTSLLITLVYPLFLFFYFFLTYFTVKFQPSFHQISSDSVLSGYSSSFITKYFLSFVLLKNLFSLKWRMMAKFNPSSSLIYSNFSKDYKASSSFSFISLEIISQFFKALYQYYLIGSAFFPS